MRADVCVCIYVSVGACGCVLLSTCLFCLVLFGLLFVSVLLLICVLISVGFLFLFVCLHVCFCFV